MPKNSLIIKLRTKAKVLIVLTGLREEASNMEAQLSEGRQKGDNHFFQSIN